MTTSITFRCSGSAWCSSHQRTAAAASATHACRYQPFASYVTPPAPLLLWAASRCCFCRLAGMPALPAVGPSAAAAAAAASSLASCCCRVCTLSASWRHHAAAENQRVCHTQATEAKHEIMSRGGCKSCMCARCYSSVCEKQQRCSLSHPGTAPGTAACAGPAACCH